MLLFRDMSHLITKKWKSVKKRTDIEDEVDDYDDVRHTKLSPEQENNKPTFAADKFDPSVLNFDAWTF